MQLRTYSNIVEQKMENNCTERIAVRAAKWRVLEATRKKEVWELSVWPQDTYHHGPQ